MSNTEQLKRYAAIKHEMALLTNELEFIKDEVLKQVRDLAGDDLKPVDCEYGTFIIARKKNWTYSPMVEQIENTLKEQKKTEQATGAASFEIEEQLRFNVKE